MGDFRIENKTFSNAEKALLGVIAHLIKYPTAQAFLRVADEDQANELRALIEDAIDRIKIEFDSSERGPNPFWTPTKLIRDNGKVVLLDSYDLTVHTKGFEAK